MQGQYRAQVPAVPPTVAGDLRLVDILRTVRERKRGVLTVSVAVFVIMTAVVALDEPVYRAYVSVAPSEPLLDNSRTTLAGSLLGLGQADPGYLEVLPLQTSKNEAFALLDSRSMSRRFIQSENLMPILFADQWDPDAGAWIDPDPAEQPSIDDALELFQRDIRFISRSNATGFMRINIEWSDPHLAARWANRLVELTDEAIRARDISEAEESIGFLQEQIDSVPQETVRQLVYSLIESYARTMMVARVKDNYAFTIIDPAVAPGIDEPINMPASFKLSLALLLALGCGFLYAMSARAWTVHLAKTSATMRPGLESDNAG